MKRYGSLKVTSVEISVNYMTLIIQVLETRLRVITKGGNVEKQLKYIAEKYGKESQLRQLQEECAELIVACSKILRMNDKAINNLIEEIADVRVMVEQIEYLYGIKNLVEDEMEYKLQRQLERIKA